MTNSRPDVSIERAFEWDGEAILAVQSRACAPARPERREDAGGSSTAGAPVPLLDETLESVRAAVRAQTVLKAMLGERVAGSVRGRIEGATCTVTRLSVEPELAGRGIGTRLMATLHEFFPHAARFELSVGATSAGALHLFEKLGYRTVRTAAGDRHDAEMVLLERQRPAATMRFRLTVLGSGPSSGVPIPACSCAVCRSADPRDRRTRSALLVQYAGRSVVIDCGPDFREQVVRAGLRRLDALVLTHDHADHLHGIDDVRSFNFAQREAIPCYAIPSAIKALRERFPYIFAPGGPGGGQPELELVPVEGPFELFGERVIPVPVEHGNAATVGYRMGDWAYLPDVKHLPQDARALVRGLDVLLVDALHKKPHPTHQSIDEALALVAALAPARAWLTHLGHRVSHAGVEPLLPAGAKLAFDGMTIDVGSPR
jgi:phosphoribosyl 1,2-cyclic phosphate phosphodiesterase